jgi:acyl carrier protein
MEMTEQEIETKLIGQLGVLLGAGEEAVQRDTPLQALGMDSMRFVEIFIFIEKEFGVELMSADMQRSDLETPRALAASIARNV